MNQIELNQRLKGRNAQQQKVIKYFYQAGGCLNPCIKDEEYEAMVMAKVKSQDFKKRAMSKLGIDEDQVKEVAPVHFEGYQFDDKAFALYGKDGRWRSSAYQLTWIFAGSSQIYVWQYTFNLDEDGQKEKTEEYFFKDITNFSSSSDTVEKVAPDKISCKGGVSYKRWNVDTNKFAIIVPGDKFFCSMTQSDYSEKAIQGLKAKLREKKG